MTAYAISEVEVLDEQRADEYRELARSSIEQYGGQYVVRGASPETVEGSWPANNRVVVVWFPSMWRARQWYDSPEYARALAVRESALDRRLLFVDGVDAEQNP